MTACQEGKVHLIGEVVAKFYDFAHTCNLSAYIKLTFHCKVVYFGRFTFHLTGLFLAKAGKMGL